MIPDEITRADVLKKEAAVLTMLETMDVPEFRVNGRDWPWLSSNLLLKNEYNPLIESALKLIRQIMRYTRELDNAGTEGPALKHRPFEALLKK